MKQGKSTWKTSLLLAWQTGPGAQNCSKRSCLCRGARSPKRRVLTHCPQGQCFGPFSPQKNCPLQVLTLNVFAFINLFFLKKGRKASCFWQFENVPPNGNGREQRMEEGQERRCHIPAWDIRHSLSRGCGPCTLQLRHLPLPTFPSLSFPQLTPPQGQKHHGVQQRDLALGSGAPAGKEIPAEGQEWEIVGPDPVSHLSQATHLHTVCGPGGHRGTWGCASPSLGENSPSPVIRDVLVPFWEAQAGTRKST